MGTFTLYLLIFSQSLVPKPISTAIQFYTTSSYDCSYLAHKRARSLVAAPSHLINSTNYSALIDVGFRRSGTFIYRPHCEPCHACTPLRVDTTRFIPSRSFKRTLKQFQHLSTTRKPLVWNDEHYALYRDYQAARHAGSDMDNADKSQYIEFLLASNVNSYLIEFRDGPTLKMVALIDEVEQGISAVYTFFDPLVSGLGTYGILWQINYCQQLQLPWLYLGYWIQQSRKMAYKTRFAPYQLFLHGEWVSSPAP